VRRRTCKQGAVYRAEIIAIVTLPVHFKRLTKRAVRFLSRGDKLMARSQTWTRNISKKVKKVKASVVNDRPLERLKRQAEDSGLIIHAQPDRSSDKKGGRK